MKRFIAIALTALMVLSLCSMFAACNKDKGFKVVGLSFDRNADAWKKAIREHYLNWIHLSDLKFWQTVAAETYGIRSIPSSILCDPTGKIVDIDLRGEKLGAKLMEIYGE
jgi:hypothetical protein